MTSIYQNICCLEGDKIKNNTIKDRNLTWTVFEMSEKFLSLLS